MIWLHATTGRGPEECQAALKGILSAIHVDAVANGLSFDLLEAEETKHGYSSALMAIDGADAEKFGKSWNGTIQWLCKSEIRPEHKRKRWFVKVEVILPKQIDDTEIMETDLVWESFRSSGPGGQSVQKTNSAVRLIHTPTKIIITSQEERSQYRNKSLALAKLYARLRQEKNDQKAKIENEQWKSHNNLERGNPVRTFEGIKFKEQKSPPNPVVPLVTI